MSFLEFLRLISPRYLQEREVGLDLYLGGIWTWMPLALGVAAATTFVLALFHAVPRRRHSIPILVGIGLTALAIGLSGTFVNSLDYPSPPDSPPRIFTDGGGRQPETAAHEVTLLALPLLVATAVLGASLLGSGFLALFGGRDPDAPAEKQGKTRKSGR